VPIPQRKMLLTALNELKEMPLARPAAIDVTWRMTKKISADAMRRLNAEVDIKARPLATVAAEFLAQAGLK